MLIVYDLPRMHCHPKPNLRLNAMGIVMIVELNGELDLCESHIDQTDQTGRISDRHIQEPAADGTPA